MTELLGDEIRYCIAVAFNIDEKAERDKQSPAANPAGNYS
jgi:hypothetical protein